MQLTDVPRRADGIVSRMVDGEAVLVHPGQGKVRVLNAVGSRLWELADGSRSAGQMAQVIADEYAVELAQAQVDALAFWVDLARRGLLNQSG